MRLAAQMKGGFYPAAPEAIREAVKRLRKPKGQWCLLDPCCGKGAALAQLAESLACSPEFVYGVELGEQRQLDAKAALPESNILGPASFFGIQSSVKSFGLVWLNPPFDDEIGGGGRVEHDFLQRATNLLVPGGIMCFVAPEDVIDSYDTKQHFKTHYTQYLAVPFPEEVRKYGEMILMGERRRTPVNPWDVDWEDEVNRQGYCHIPESPKPRSFIKIDLTDEEYAEAMQNSPLRSFLEPPPEAKMPEPPMSLGKGHIALLLAAGHLDGTVRPEGEMPHVVRGVAQKVEYVSNVEENENDKGQVTTKTTISQKILMTVRAVAADGTLKTFAQE